MIQKLFLFFLLFMNLCCTSQKAKVDDTVVLFLDANIPHLDPIHSTNKYSSTVISNIFEGLYHYHYLKRPITLEPSLAEGEPQISPDGKTYTIQLKKGVFFQDDPAFPNGKGRELKAEDFIYSWRRLADPMNKAMGWWVLDGLIVGLNEWRNDLRAGKANYQTPIKGLSAPHSHTLVIQLTRPSFQFLHFLAMPVTMVVAQEVVEKYGQEIANHPIGTGPYRLEHWDRNSEVRLIKNKNFREVFYPSEGSAEDEKRGLLSHKGQRLPLSEKITVKVITERQPLWLSFLKGQVDHGVVPTDNFDQVFENNQLKKEFVDKGIRVLEQYRPDVTMIAFNMEHPLLGKNKKLRLAFAHALNSDLILEKFYNRRGIVAQGPLPPLLDGYDPDYKNNLDFNLEKARQLLKEAGYPDGKDLPVFDFELSNNATWSRQMGELLKDLWGQVGIQIRLVINTWPQFDQKLKNKQATLFEMAWSADYPDSENFLQLFYSKNVSPGSNNSNFINRDYDQLYEKALQLPPSPERTLLYKKMVDFINNEVPTLFLVHRIYRLPYHSWLENYNEHPIIYDFYRYLKVNTQIKEKNWSQL